MRPKFPLVILLGLAACAGPIETRLLSAGEANIDALSYSYSKPTAAASAEYGMARALIIEALSKRNFRNAENAPVLLQMAVSERPANLGLKRGEGENVKVIAPTKKRKLFQSCKDREYRLSLRFTQVSDGRLLYSGEAAQYHCKLGLSEALPGMVDAVIADIDGPRGAKVIKRRGRE
ncbi:MAG: hypothetical protein V3V15_01655 [Sphingorhabdus sp.]